MNLIGCKCLHLEGGVAGSWRKQKTGFEKKGMFGGFGGVAGSGREQETGFEDKGMYGDFGFCF